MSKNDQIELRTLLVSALGVSLATWEIVFNFAIHGTVFYDKLMAVWVIATVLLLGLFFSGQQQMLGRWGMLALLLPTAWFAFFALAPRFASVQIAPLLWAVAIVIFIVAIGYILFVLAWLLDSDGVTLSAAYRNRLIIIVLTVAVVAFLIGRNHQHFVSCQQFQLAGDSVPADCGESEFWDSIEPIQ